MGLPSPAYWHRISIDVSVKAGDAWIQWCHNAIIILFICLYNTNFALLKLLGLNEITLNL